MYAFWKRREWIRLPTLVYSGAVIFEVGQFILVSIIDRTESTDVLMLIGFNILWFLFPFGLIWRVWKTPVFAAD